MIEIFKLDIKMKFYFIQITNRIFSSWIHTHNHIISMHHHHQFHVLIPISIHLQQHIVTVVIHQLHIINNKYHQHFYFLHLLLLSFLKLLR
jgi:hypothetical protein